MSVSTRDAADSSATAIDRQKSAGTETPEGDAASETAWQQTQVQSPAGDELPSSDAAVRAPSDG